MLIIFENIMENGAFAHFIFNNILTYNVAFQRRQKAFLWRKGLKLSVEYF